jgi:hypothetical protein
MQISYNRQGEAMADGRTVRQANVGKCITLTGQALIG